MNSKNSIMKSIFLVIVFAFTCLALSACGDTTDYVMVAIERAKTFLNDKGYEYEDVLAENPRTINGIDGYFYDLVVVLNSDQCDYNIVLNLLNDLDNSSYGAESYKEKQIVFMEYVVCGEYAYNVRSTNEFVLERRLSTANESGLAHNSSSLIYNSIAAKNGEDITDKEKAWLYKELDYNLTHRTDGKYTYTTEEAYNIVAEQYCVSVESLEQIYNFGWDNYQKYYGK